MKKLLGLAGAGFLFAGAALAADLARKAPVYTAPPPPPPPVFTWQGWYIGGNAGYGWGENTSPTFFTTTLGGLPTALPNLKPKGFIGGGQIGYD